MADLFDNLPPFVHGSDTSRAAAESIEPAADTLRRVVLDWIRQQDSRGSTDEEGIDGTHIAASTYRPRRVELWRAGLVQESGGHRKTQSGRLAVVWVAVKAATGVPAAYRERR